MSTAALSDQKLDVQFKLRPFVGILKLKMLRCFKFVAPVIMTTKNCGAFSSMKTNSPKGQRALI